MKSTTSLRPAIPPDLLMYLAKPCTAAGEDANRPGRNWLSTSATTAMRISFAVMPMSDAGSPLLGLRPRRCRQRRPAPAATTVASATIRRPRMRPPERLCPTSWAQSSHG